MAIQGNQRESVEDISTLWMQMLTMLPTENVTIFSISSVVFELHAFCISSISLICLLPDENWPYGFFCDIQSGGNENGHTVSGRN